MGSVAFSTDGGHPFGGGLLHLALPQLQLLLEVLLLAFGLLQTGVLLGIDLREAGQLLPQPAQLLFKVVAAAALGLEGLAEAIAAGSLGGFIGSGCRIRAGAVLGLRAVLLAGLRALEVQEFVAITSAAGGAGDGGCGSSGHDPSRLSVDRQPIAALPSPVAEAEIR